jgi:hypothetical protein
MMGDKLDVGERPMDVPRIIQAARTGATSLVAQGAHYSVAAASPREVAQILDAISRSISAFARFQTRATIMPSERNGREL